MPSAHKGRSAAFWQVLWVDRQARHILHGLPSFITGAVTSKSGPATLSPQSVDDFVDPQASCMKFLYWIPQTQASLLFSEAGQGSTVDSVLVVV